MNTNVTTLLTGAQILLIIVTRPITISCVRRYEMDASLPKNHVSEQNRQPPTRQTIQQQPTELKLWKNLSIL